MIYETHRIVPGVGLKGAVVNEIPTPIVIFILLYFLFKHPSSFVGALTTNDGNETDLRSSNANFSFMLANESQQFSHSN